MAMNDEFDAWIGRTDEAEDTLTPRRYASMAVALDLDLAWPETGTALPPSWNWAYFTPLSPTAGLDRDGHEKHGRFLPPLDLPRRMWAGSRIEYATPLSIGQTARRVSTVKSITRKEGRSGKLVFILVEHRILVGDEAVQTEEQDIVYREAPQVGATPPTPPPAPEDADFTKQIVPTPSLLFRYSALTFNTHKIHLDRDYCRDVEGYPGLVVHGPLIATLLLDVVRENLPDATVAKFDFRAVSPLFDVDNFTVNGRRTGDRTVELWAANHQGGLATKAEAVLL